MRRLIVCADGTWNRNEEQLDGGGRTNVAIVHDNLAAVGGGVAQKAFYDQGVGTGKFLDRILGGAFGSGIAANIRDDCYGFLVREFSPGDELFLIGFSRGAYTVRSLAGMIRKCGIIRRSAGNALGSPLDARERAAIARAYAFYRERGSETHPSGEQATAFRREHSHETRIHFLGVWDTVGALGIPTRGPVGMISRRRHAFHDVKLSSHVHHAYHALAIDERRKPFSPAIWEIPEDDPALRTGAWTVEQRWFAGVHSNVGGGYPDRRLSSLPLRWIVRKASEHGLAFAPEFEESLDDACDCEGTRYESMSRMYEVLGEHRRKIFEPRRDARNVPVLTFEDIDSSVPERVKSRRLADLDAADGYRPPNFIEWWRGQPDRWHPDHRYEEIG